MYFVLMRIKSAGIQVTLLIIFLGTCIAGHSQTGVWNPFKLVVIQPDTAIVSSNFDSDKDSLEAIKLLKDFKPDLLLLDTLILLGSNMHCIHSYNTDLFVCLQEILFT